jgi:hypothetical protein
MTDEQVMERDDQQDEAFFEAHMAIQQVLDMTDNLQGVCRSPRAPA